MSEEYGHNQVNIVGRIGNEPVLRATKAGVAVANFYVTTDEHWKKDGVVQSRQTRIYIAAWGKLAEKCTQNLSVGQAVYISGKLASRLVTDSDGKKIVRTEVLARRVMPGASKKPEEALDFQEEMGDDG